MKALIIAALIICFFGTSTLWAQLDHYPTYDEYAAMMEKFQEDYLQIAKLHDLGPAGDTNAHHRIYAIQISDNVSQNEQEPSFLYISKNR